MVTIHVELTRGAVLLVFTRHQRVGVTMNRLTFVFASVLIASSVPGCALQQITSKTKFGPEFRDKATKNEVRWTSIQQGFDFTWENGLKTGITYRRRDTDAGNGGNDNGIWFDFSFPIWKAKKTDTTTERLQYLERRLAALERANPELLARMNEQERAVEHARMHGDARFIKDTSGSGTQ